jgi:uncharacterized protein YfbU (UPF0304 family)
LTFRTFYRITVLLAVVFPGLVVSSRTERFEMRLDTDLIEKIDSWGAGQVDSPSRAEAIRRLVERGLEGTDAQVRPNGTERLMLWMLSEVLKGQFGEGTDERIKLIQDVLFGGHFWALGLKMPALIHSNIDSKADLKFVQDTLEMWNIIELSIESLNESDKNNISNYKKAYRFCGFDGNKEYKFLAIANFLIDNMGYYNTFRGRDLNSHIEKLEKYKNMLFIFSQKRSKLNGRNLEYKEICELIDLD